MAFQKAKILISSNHSSVPAVVLAVFDPIRYPAEVVPSLPKELLADSKQAVPQPDYWIIDLQSSTLSLEELGRFCTLCDKSKILVLGQENNIGYYRKLKSLGVAEYFISPLQKEELLSFWTDAQGENAFRSSHAVVPLVSSRVGVGATTCAINIASILAYECNYRVCLIDMDLFQGDLGIYLNVPSQAGFSDLVSQADRLDNALAKQFLYEKEPGFFVLPNNYSVGQLIEEAYLNDIRNTVRYLQSMFDVLILDIPTPAFGFLMPHLFDLFSQLIGVTDYHLSSMRNTVKLQAWIKEHSPDLPMHWIVNDPQGFDNKAQIQSALEHALGALLVLTLPCSKRLLAEAELEGVSLFSLQPRSRYAKKIRNWVIEWATHTLAYKKIHPKSNWDLLWNLMKKK